MFGHAHRSITQSCGSGSVSMPTYPLRVRHESKGLYPLLPQLRPTGAFPGDVGSSYLRLTSGTPAVKSGSAC
jgi:hypothetical protein